MLKPHRKCQLIFIHPPLALVIKTFESAVVHVVPPVRSLTLYQVTRVRFVLCLFLSDVPHKVDGQVKESLRWLMDSFSRNSNRQRRRRRLCAIESKNSTANTVTFMYCMTYLDLWHIFVWRWKHSGIYGMPRVLCVVMIDTKMCMWCPALGKCKLLFSSISVLCDNREKSKVLLSSIPTTNLMLIKYSLCSESTC